MGTARLLAAAGLLLSLAAAGASAAPRDRRHPGHQPRLNTATYTVPARLRARVLRMAHHAPPGAHAAQAGQGRGGGAVRFAQASRHRSLMGGS